MTLSDFQTLIQGKFFIELASPLAVTSFIGSSQESQNIRAAADTAGVIVFLKNVNRIYAHGGYYGATDALVEKVNELDTAISSLNPPLAQMAGLVATNQSNISKLVTLIGASELPAETNNIISRISNLELEISAISGGTSLTDAVNEMVDNRLNSVLDGKIADYLENNNYVDKDDLDALEQTIGSQLTTLTSAINEKAAQTDFSNLVALIGACSLSDQNWGHNDTTVVTVVNSLMNTTQTLTTDVSNLRTSISGIPHFEVQVVSQLPTLGQNGTTPGDAKLSTIYLLLSPSDEREVAEQGQDESLEMYTEYICINTNAGKTNETTGEPEAPHYKWEKLGRQAFKMSQYLNEEQVKNITDALADEIEDLVSKVLGENAGSVNDPILSQLNDVKDRLDNAESSITTLQGQMTSIQTAINLLVDSDGNFKLTGSDIATSSTDNTSIADSIATLQSNKLDTTALNWVVISEDIQQNNG